MAFVDGFDINIREALRTQLIESLSRLTPEPLSAASLSYVPNKPGVYQLYHNNVLTYVGKSESSLSNRLGEHVEKISGRKHITISDMSFVCLHLNESWTALAPESALIAHYAGSGLCRWNGTGFGIHDPGRDRETTKKPPHGFDALFPIKENWSCDIEARDWECIELLVEIKKSLPFLLRYQLDPSGHWTKGHSDHRGLMITVPSRPMPVDDLLRLIVRSLPGWQATLFKSHMILYKEHRSYGTIGTVL